MLNKIKNNIVIIIAIIIVLVSVCIDLIPNIFWDTKEKLVIYIFAMFLVFINMKIKNRKSNSDKKENRKKTVNVIFIIYTILILSLLLIDGQYRRFGFENTIKLFSKEHFELYSNFIPFATIYDFIKRITDGTINTSIVVTNIIGNIIAFAPYGILIPMINKEKFDNIKNFTLLMIGIVFSVECIQFITRQGTFDIDDIILNVFGAVSMFFIMKIKVVRKIVENVLK